MKKTAGKYQRMVIKLGTSLLTGGKDQLDQETMASLVTQVAALRQQGQEIIIVSSGAIASGRSRLGRSREIKGVPMKQALAAVGQHHLMGTYEALFSQYDIPIAQALLSRTDMLDRAGYLNARNTLLALLEMGVVGIVNENDVVAVDELNGATFGDNDNLSAMVANLVDADLLMLLTDIGGLYTADPRCAPNACLVPEVAKIDSKVERLAAGTASSQGTGGMVTKVEAARLAISSGVTVIIASGREPEVILRLARGEALGTRFLPVTTRVESRKRWMLSGLATRGRLVVDPGAAIALREQKRSLLAAGVKAVSGTFHRGDIVKIYDPDGSQIGCGITNYSAADIAVIKGMHSRQIAGAVGQDYGAEVVHRNNLVVVE